MSRKKEQMDKAAGKAAEESAAQDNIEPGSGLGPGPGSEPGAAPEAGAQPTDEAGAPDPAALIADLNDKLLRALAEAENVRRRAERQVADAGAYAVTSFARDLLNVSDNLRRALDAAASTEGSGTAADSASFLSGVEMTERELLNVFERHGIRKIVPKGEKFDHNFHQAMFEVESTEAPAGTILEVVQPGYVLKDRLLRPAMVGVAKSPANAGGGKESQGGIDETV